MSTATLQGRTAPRTGLRNVLIFTPLLGYALALYALWGSAASPWVKGAASLGIPAGLLLLLGLGVVALGRLLPPLDRGVGTRTDRTVWCWGNNDHGQLGLGDTSVRTTPTQVSGRTGRVFTGGSGSASTFVIN